MREPFSTWLCRTNLVTYRQYYEPPGAGWVKRKWFRLKRWLFEMPEEGEVI